MKEKDYKLDLLRALSMLLVVVVHVSNYYCRAFDAHEISSGSFLGAVIFDTVARISVPIFFMISGGLLLGRPYSPEKNKKRIIDRFISLAAFTVIFYFWDRFFMHKTDINLVKILAEPERSLLWFMYAILALYLALPFIKCMTDNMHEHEDKLFVILWLIFSGITSVVMSRLGYSTFYPVPIVSGTYYLGYFVLGHIILKYKNKIDFKKRNALFAVIAAASAAIIALVTYITSVNKNRYVHFLFSYRNVFMICMSVCAFLLIYFSIPNKYSKVIAVGSENSMGVYLVHGIVLDFVMKYFPFRSLNAFWGVPVCTVMVFIPAFAIVWALRKIPFLRKYL